MSEGFTVGGPEQQPGVPGPADGGPGDPSPIPPAPPLRPPVWRRRSILLTGIAAAVVTIVAVAAVVVWPGSGSGQYTSLPSACSMVTAGKLAKYVPGAVSAEEDTYPQAQCTWLSSSGGRINIELTLNVGIFETSSGRTFAQQAFVDETRLGLFSPYNEITLSVTKESVTGLGDQAAARVARPGPGFPSHGSVLALWVRSGNAILTLVYAPDVTGSAQVPAAPQMLSDTIAMARDVLTVLATPWAASAPPAARPSSPRYAPSRDTCGLVMGSTLAQYLPGFAPANVTGEPNSCFWVSMPGGDYLELIVTVFGAANGLAQAYALNGATLSSDIQGITSGGTRMTVNWVEPVKGLGESATAIFQTWVFSHPRRTVSHEVILFAWAANAECEVDITYHSNIPPRSTQLAAATAVARDVLTYLPRS